MPAAERPAILRFFQALNAAVCRVWYRLHCDNRCTVPPVGPAIVTANHTCSADPLMISAACRYRKISFFIAEEYSNYPVGRWFVRLIECIPVNREGRDTAATKTAIRRLRSGAVLGIFIEGRIPDPGQQAEPKDGVAVLALRTGAPVIPVHISGNKWRRGVARGFLARHRTRLRFGNPVDLSDLQNRSREDVTTATARIFRAIQDLAPRAD